jgi:GT2 family glycosyltransferase
LPVLSIIVPARNNPEFTANCLATILFSVSRLNLNCEFILVDDASAPEEKILDVFRQHRANATGHQTKIVRSRKHQHYSGVFSLGLHFATRDIIFFISNDMLVTPSFLQAVLLVSSLSREFGIVRGTSNYTDSHPEHWVEAKEPLKNFPDVDTFSRGVFSGNGCAFVEDKVLSGDAILLKRDLIEKIGVLDLRFFGYFGDVDFGMRAHLAGFKLVCAKGAWLFHEGSGHVKGDMARDKTLTLEKARDQRFAMVETAYQEFRKKWGISSPEIWGGGGSAESIHFFDRARAYADRAELKYDFPLPVLDDVETY